MNSLTIALIGITVSFVANAVLGAFVYFIKQEKDRINKRLDGLEERERAQVKDAGGLQGRFEQIHQTHVDIDRRLVRLETPYFKGRKEGQ